MHGLILSLVHSGFSWASPLPEIFSPNKELDFL